MLFIARLFFSLYTLTWRANNYVSLQGIGINRRNESTKNTIIISTSTEILFSHFVSFATIFFDSKQVDCLH